jgi:hypothetical protein
MSKEELLTDVKNLLYRRTDDVAPEGDRRH